MSAMRTGPALRRQANRRRCDRAAEVFLAHPDAAQPDGVEVVLVDGAARAASCHEGTLR
jgi:hypothetical protein